ncbi:alanine/glycine:cation symporter family protein [Brachybacterium vulturis]|uniref:alanine/glycine:cation symporter family protein n=1 Tax=Brachybacterium vulturis TaxID=2017484 RepID=UPI0037367066
MDLLSTLNGWIWNPMAYFALAVGLFFTILTGAVQFRRLPDMFRQVLAKPHDSEGVAPLQALLLTLASRVGVGNIAGVATAIAAGGPGALFWMVVTALLGSASAFAETVLAQVFKRRIDGEHRGGAPFYVEFGLHLKWLAVSLAVGYMFFYGFVFSGVQSNNIATSVEVAFGVPTWVTAILLTGLLGFTVIGGTKRIIHAAQIMVPVMALVYILFTAVIIVLNLDQVLPTIELVLASAFGRDQIFGGIAGAAIAWGVRRAVFSNVAGVGEGTFGSAAASTSHPAKQGLVQSLSVFLDTIVVCTATGIMIIITGSFNVVHRGQTLVENIPGVEAGVTYTQTAIDSAVGGFGPAFVAIALFFFAFTTMVAFYYIAETNLGYLCGSTGGWPSAVLKTGAMAITAFGALVSADAMWLIGDIGYGLLGWTNMLIILALSPVVYTVIKDYDRQRKQGLDPSFDPAGLGISDADFWTSSTPADADADVAR